MFQVSTTILWRDRATAMPKASSNSPSNSRSYKGQAFQVCWGACVTKALQMRLRLFTLYDYNALKFTCIFQIRLYVSQRKELNILLLHAPLWYFPHPFKTHTHTQNARHENGTSLLLIFSMHFKNNHQISPSTNDVKIFNIWLRIWFLATQNISFQMWDSKSTDNTKQEVLFKYRSDSTLNNILYTSVLTQNYFYFSGSFLK